MSNIYNRAIKYLVIDYNKIIRKKVDVQNKNVSENYVRSYISNFLFVEHFNHVVQKIQHLIDKFKVDLKHMRSNL